MTELATLVETALMVLEPVYSTYKVLKTVGDAESKSASSMGEKPKSRQLLIHWIVYSVVRVVDCAVHKWLPFYASAKIVAVVWLRSGGSEVAYDRFIGPLLTDNEAATDRFFGEFDRVRNQATSVKETLSSVAAAVITNDPLITTIE